MILAKSFQPGAPMCPHCDKPRVLWDTFKIKYHGQPKWFVTCPGNPSRHILFHRIVQHTGDDPRYFDTCGSIACVETDSCQRIQRAIRSHLARRAFLRSRVMRATEALRAACTAAESHVDMYNWSAYIHAHRDMQRRFCDAEILMSCSHAIIIDTVLYKKSLDAWNKYFTTSLEFKRLADIVHPALRDDSDFEEGDALHTAMIQYQTVSDEYLTGCTNMRLEVERCLQFFEASLAAKPAKRARPATNASEAASLGLNSSSSPPPPSSSATALSPIEQWRAFTQFRILWILRYLQALGYSTEQLNKIAQKSHIVRGDSAYAREIFALLGKKPHFENELSHKEELLKVLKKLPMLLYAAYQCGIPQLLSAIEIVRPLATSLHAEVGDGDIEAKAHLLCTIFENHTHADTVKSELIKLFEDERNCEFFHGLCTEAPAPILHPLCADSVCPNVSLISFRPTMNLPRCEKGRNPSNRVCAPPPPPLHQKRGNGGGRALPPPPPHQTGRNGGGGAKESHPRLNPTPSIPSAPSSNRKSVAIGGKGGANKSVSPAPQTNLSLGVQAPAVKAAAVQAAAVKAAFIAALTASSVGNHGMTGAKTRDLASASSSSSAAPSSNRKSVAKGGGGGANLPSPSVPSLFSAFLPSESDKKIAADSNSSASSSSHASPSPDGKSIETSEGGGASPSPPPLFTGNGCEFIALVSCGNNSNELTESSAPPSSSASPSPVGKSIETVEEGGASPSPPPGSNSSCSYTFTPKRASDYLIMTRPWADQMEQDAEYTAHLIREYKRLGWR